MTRPTTRRPRAGWTPATLRAWREARDLTQQEMADRFGVALRTYRRWETGECPISKPVQLLLDRMAEPTLERV